MGLERYDIGMVAYVMSRAILGHGDRMAKLIDGVMKGRPARTPEQVDADFLSRFVKRESGCWEWTGTLEKRGYGVLQIEKKQWRAHRYAYVRVHGPVSDSLLICHRCNNKLCVNPDHLYAGSNQDNMDDCVVAGTHRGINNGRAKLTEDEVREIRRLYEVDERSQVWIAKRFKTSQSHVSEIVRRVEWKHVD